MCASLEGGRIAHIGPTLRRLGLATTDKRERFRDVFEILRPVSLRDPGCLRELAGAPLRIGLRQVPDTPVLRGLAVALPQGGLIINLSFGIGLVDAVSRFELTQTDFAATDLAVEMLYLFEAKSAVMAESQRLNAYLEDARSIAEEQAFTDTLTGLGNRRAMEHALDLLLERGDAFSVLHLDLDHFKEVNDTFGHAAGDLALVEAADVLKSETRRQDIATRVGGDEFIVLIYGPTDEIGLRALAQRVISRLEVPVSYGNAMLNFSGSVGIATVRPGGRGEATDILAVADAALYASKTAGRGCVTLNRYDPEEVGLVAI